jgi:hypothetical protein
MARRRAPRWLSSLAVGGILGFFPARAGAQAEEDDYFHPFESEAIGATLRRQPPAQEPPAREPAAPPFGARGEAVMTGASAIGVSSTQWDNSQASSFSLIFAPGADYFVAHNLSIGVSLDLAYGDGKGYGADSSVVETRTTTVSGGPRVGYNVPLGNAWSFFPRLTVGFEYVQRQESLVSGNTFSIPGSPLGYPSSTEFGPYVSLDLKLLVHPKPHFFVGFGPSIFHEFGHVQGGPDVGGERTTASAGVVVGGWFGGPAVEPLPADVEPQPPPTTRRFGERGEVVLTSELSLSGSWTGYAGTSSSSTSFSFGPGLDYFAVSRFSIGFYAWGSAYGSTGIDAATGAQVTYSSSGDGFAPRIGVDIPLGDLLSWYPQASIGLGEEHWDETAGGGQNKHDEHWISAGLYAPLLVHAAPHVFAGFGPSASQDLMRTDQANYSNRSTNLGASLVVGGWI